MRRQVTIEVSEEVARQASRIASQTSRRIEEVLTEWLQSVINEMPLESLPDEDVLALTELSLSNDEQGTLNYLLALNADDKLDSEQKNQLEELMRVYERGSLRKAQALRVAVQRGLRGPLQA